MRLTLKLLPAALAASIAFAPAASAQKTKRALKESDARRAVAATPGFALNRGAVRVLEVSPAGATPVVVRAEVEVAVGFTKAEGAEAGGRPWRVVEFRTGDRSWESFEYFVGPLPPGAVEDARLALEEMAAEFEARRREREKAGEEKEPGEEKAGGAEAGDEKKIEVRRGPVALKEFAPIYKSARGVVTVEATFRLERLAGKWQVAGFRIGDFEVGNFAELTAAVNRRKAERARADLETIRLALEEFRRERGVYVVADSEAALIDHLNPRYLKSVIRIDPWNRPYRYDGTRDSYTISSDGPDGLPSTHDDVSTRR